MKNYFYMRLVLTILAISVVTSFPGNPVAQEQPRARDLGIPFEGIPGPLNAITDVKGIEVGHTTLISGGNGSGDIFIAFSNANPGVANPKDDVAKLTMLPNNRMNALFSATVFATEEAIMNALIAAETMTGRDGHTVDAIPHDRLKAILKKYNRLLD